MPVSALHPLTAATATSKAAAAGKPAAACASFASTLAQASATTKADSTKATERSEILDSKKVPKGEKTKPVEGHAYSDITAGPRNGMYLNTSGNKRHGMAFVLVKRDGKEYHIYGTGKDRLVVCLKPKAETDETAKTKTETQNTATSGTTGS